jgi:gas vesicle protein
MNHKKKIALSAIIAGVAGYGIGLLTAPKSGKDTRKDIKNTAQKTIIKIKLQKNKKKRAN